MNKILTTDCKEHIGQKVRKFCKSPECWMKTCPKCATEFHKGHKVIDLFGLVTETKAAKEKLIRTKKNDLATLKAIGDGLTAMNLQVSTTKNKFQEEAKIIEMNFLAKIKSVVEENELKCKEMQAKILEFKENVNDMYNTQSKELARITELTNAVLTKGSDEDFKIFFEMCEKGMQSNSEIAERKSMMEVIKATVKDFYSNNNFTTVFNNSTTFLDLMNTPSPDKSKDLSIDPKEVMITKSESKASSVIKRHTRVKSAAPEEILSSLKVTSPKDFKRLTDKNVAQIFKSPIKRLTVELSSLQNPRAVKQTSTGKVVVHRKRGSEVPVFKNEFKKQDKTNYEEKSARVVKEYKKPEDFKLALKELRSELQVVVGSIGKLFAPEGLIKDVMERMEKRIQMEKAKNKAKVEELAKVLSNYVTKNWVRERKGLCIISINSCRLFVGEDRSYRRDVGTNE